MYSELDQKLPWNGMRYIHRMTPMGSMSPGTSTASAPIVEHQVPVPGYACPPSTATKRLSAWVNSNVFSLRPLRHPQMYLHGPPRTGKTTFVQLLEKYLRIYHFPMDEDFYDFYDDELYDLIVLDEFRGQKTIQHLNRWLDGQKMTYRKKGSQGLKTKNLPIIIISNYSPQEVYHKVAEHGRLDSFLDRLEIIEVREMLELESIEFLPPVVGMDTNGSPLFAEEPEEEENLEEGKRDDYGISDLYGPGEVLGPTGHVHSLL